MLEKEENFGNMSFTVVTITNLMFSVSFTLLIIATHFLNRAYFLNINNKIIKAQSIKSIN